MYHLIAACRHGAIAASTAIQIISTDHHTWHGLDSLVSSCVRSEHVAHVAASCRPLDGFGGREGAIDPATEAHHSWLIEGGP